jgi:hypothetical protein
MNLCVCVNEYHRNGEGAGDSYLGCHIHVHTDLIENMSTENEVYYESIKREPKIRGINKCRCDPRVKVKFILQQTARKYIFFRRKIFFQEGD